MAVKVKDAEIAAVIQRTFPKHTKSAYSFAKNTPYTGVMLCPEAERIKAEYLQQRAPKKPDNRKFKFRIYGRIPDELAARIQTRLAEEGRTMQDLLLDLLTKWMEEEGHG